MSFEVLRTAAGGGRRGRLWLPHGGVETPVFMPVGTQATVKAVPQDVLEGLGRSGRGAQIILANTYHLYLRPGHELVRRMGGLHRFMGWERPMLTDSGGFQVWSLSKLRKVTAEGVEFRSHLDGRKHFFSPEHSMAVQIALGADVAMAFDECVETPATWERTRESMRLTHAWAERSKEYFERHKEEVPWFGGGGGPTHHGEAVMNGARGFVGAGGGQTTATAKYGDFSAAQRTMEPFVAPVEMTSGGVPGFVGAGGGQTTATAKYGDFSAAQRTMEPFVAPVEMTSGGVPGFVGEGEGQTTATAKYGDFSAAQRTMEPFVAPVEMTSGGVPGFVGAGGGQTSATAKYGDFSAAQRTMEPFVAPVEMTSGGVPGFVGEGEGQTTATAKYGDFSAAQRTMEPFVAPVEMTSGGVPGFVGEGEGQTTATAKYGDFSAAQRTMEPFVAPVEMTSSLVNDGTAGQTQRLFGIVQGGMYADLRRESAERLVAMDLPGYAIGGLAVGEPREVTREMIARVLEVLPKDKPRYVMGVGYPDEIEEYARMGVDMMDCVLPTRAGRHGLVFARVDGRVARMNIKRLEYAEDGGPIDAECGCGTCRRYSRAYLRHLVAAGEPLAATLLSVHNLAFYLDTMERVRGELGGADVS